MTSKPALQGEKAEDLQAVHLTTRCHPRHALLTVLTVLGMNCIVLCPVWPPRTIKSNTDYCWTSCYVHMQRTRRTKTNEEVNVSLEQREQVVQEV